MDCSKVIYHIHSATKAAIQQSFPLNKKTPPIGRKGGGKIRERGENQQKKNKQEGTKRTSEILLFKYAMRL